MRARAGCATSPKQQSRRWKRKSSASPIPVAETAARLPAAATAQAQAVGRAAARPPAAISVAEARGPATSTPEGRVARVPALDMAAARLAAAAAAVALAAALPADRDV